MASKVLGVPVSFRKMIMVGVRLMVELGDLEHLFQLKWFCDFEQELRSKLNAFPQVMRQVGDEKGHWSQFSWIPAQHLLWFSSNQTTDFMSISEAIHAWTETFALQTALGWTGNGQGDSFQ